MIFLNKVFNYCIEPISTKDISILGNFLPIESSKSAFNIDNTEEYSTNNNKKYIENNKNASAFNPTASAI